MSLWLINYFAVTLATFSAKSYHQTKFARRSAALSIDQSAGDSENEEELDLDLPYGIQNVRKRMARHKPDHTKSVSILDTKKKKQLILIKLLFFLQITYQSLCPTKRIAIPLETSGYEYRPSNYIEVTCAHYTPAHSYELRKNRVSFTNFNNKSNSLILL